MSKRLCISLRNSEYEAIEEEAKKRGLKPIDIINKSIKDSVKIETVSGNVELLSNKLESERYELKKELKELRDVVFNMQKIVVESVRMSTEYASYSKIVLHRLLSGLMKTSTSEEVANKMEEILNESIVDSKKSFDKILGKF
jgi:hypothetical protein